MPFVGLTGGIAAGKSEALRALERIGAATLSSDDVVHELLTTGEVRDMLIERFGDKVAPDGEIDRGAVAEVVFGDPQQREWLEGLLWPRVGERIASWREGLEHADPQPRAAVVEVPLLFEAGMEAAFDTHDRSCRRRGDSLRPCRRTRSHGRRVEDFASAQPGREGAESRRRRAQRRLSRRVGASAVLRTCQY